MKKFISLGWVAVSIAAVLVAVWFWFNLKGNVMNDSMKSDSSVSSSIVSAPNGEVPLIPRKVLFGNPDKTSVSISPDGKRLAYLAPRDGVLNVFVAERVKQGRAIEDAKPVTNDVSRGVRSYFWGYDKKHIFYVQDEGGNEDWHLHKVDLATLADTDLTPFKGATAYVAKMDYKTPNTIIVGLNKEDPKYFDLYKLDVPSGKLEMFYKNDQKFSRDFVIDSQFHIRFASKSNDDGGRTVFEFQPDGSFKPFMEIDQENSLTTGLAGLTEDASTLYLVDSRDRDMAGLFSYDMRTKQQKLLFENAKADVGGTIRKPTTKVVQAVYSDYLKQDLHVLDESIRADVERLKAEHPDAVMTLNGRDLTDQHWIVVYMFDDKPVSYYIYDRRQKSLEFLFNNRHALVGYKLAKMQPVVIKARDGLELVSYLTLPSLQAAPEAHAKQSRKNHPLPLVLDVHGGPQSRDSWGLNNATQWLANRGYAVLQVNYRGSTGFGKNFINAGNREWAGKMHDDLLDAVQWAIDSGVTTKDQVCIYGGSYGGYSTLVGLAFTPDIFACGVDIVGSSNLVTLLKSIPPYWASYYKNLLNRIGGDPDTEAGRKFLESRSPITLADRIKRPLLIAQGANDPRVKQAESDQIVAALKKHHIPFTYLLYPDEGHGFVRPENRMSFFALAEQFLAKYLGGRAEPVGDAVRESTVKVEEE